MRVYLIDTVAQNLSDEDFIKFADKSFTMEEFESFFNSNKESKYRVRFIDDRKCFTKDEFHSWAETHYMIVTELQSYIDADDMNLAKKQYDIHGTGGMFELAQSFTDEFEKINKDRDWDGQFYDEIASFVHNKVVKEFDEAAKGQTEKEMDMILKFMKSSFNDIVPDDYAFNFGLLKKTIEISIHRLEKLNNNE